MRAPRQPSRLVHVATAALCLGPLLGCESSNDGARPTASATAASATATSATTASAIAASGTPLTAAKPKAYGATAADALGTLPDGVGIPVGTQAPDFTLPSVDGTAVRLATLIESSWVLLVFYRGGW